MPPHTPAQTTPARAPRAWAVLAGVLYATSIAVAMLNTAPAAEALLIHVAPWTSAQVGAVFGIELSAMGMASLPSALWLGRIEPARVSRWAYILFILGNLLSPWSAQSFAAYAFARALVGFGAGTLMVLGLSLAARMPNPDRVFALITTTQLASGALLLWAFSALAETGHDLETIFLVFAALGGIGLTATSGTWKDTWKANSLRSATPRDEGRLEWRAWPKGLWVVALGLAFNTVVGGLWSFAGEYAVAGAMPTDVAGVMAWASVAGLVGAVLAGRLAQHGRRRERLFAGYAGIAFAVGVLQFVRGSGGLLAGCCLLALSWNFCVPLIFATFASHDASDRGMAAANLAFAFGLALGPVLAGLIIESSGLAAWSLGASAGLAIVAALTYTVSRPSTP